MKTNTEKTAAMEPAATQKGRGATVMYRILTVGMLALIVIILGFAAFDFADMRFGTKFIPKRVLLDAKEQQDHAMLILDAETDALQKQFTVREMGCVFKIPHNKEMKERIALHAFYDDTMGHVDIGANHMQQFHMRLMHGGIPLKRLQRSLRRKRLRLEDLVVDCTVTYAYERFHPIAAPEFTHTFMWSLRDLAEKMSSQLTGEQPKKQRSPREWYSKKISWGFERSSPLKPQMRKLSIEGTVEGKATLYIPYGRFAASVYSLLKMVPVEVKADVSYVDAREQAFRGGASARGRVDFLRSKYGDVTLKLPLTTKGSASIPTVTSMMARAYNSEDDRFVEVSNEPRSFFGGVLGSTRKISMSRIHTATTGTTWSEIGQKFRHDGGRSLQTVTMGVWSATASITLTPEDDQQFNISAYVTGGTPLRAGITLDVYSANEEQNTLYVYNHTSMMSQPVHIHKDVETSISVGAHASFNSDTDAWSADVTLNTDTIDPIETNASVGVGLHFSYINDRLTGIVNFNISDEEYSMSLEDRLNNPSSPYTSKPSDHRTKVHFDVLFQGGTIFPKTATIVADIDLDEFPITTIDYATEDMAGSVEKHTVSLTQQTATLTADTKEMKNPTQFGTNEYGGRYYSLYSLGNSQATGELTFQSTMSVSAEVKIDKSSSTKWQVQLHGQGASTCQLQNNAQFQNMVSQGVLSQSDLQTTNPICYTCKEGEEDGIQYYPTGCATYDAWKLPSMKNVSSSSLDCCYAEGQVSPPEPYDGKTCCNSNPAIDAFAAIWDVGTTHTGSETTEMDPILSDLENMKVSNPSDPDFPSFELDIEAKNDVLTVTGKIELDGEEKLKTNIRLHRLNDMSLTLEAKDEFKLTASGTAPSQAGKEGAVITSLLVDSEQAQIFKADITATYDQSLITVTNDGAIQLKDNGVLNLDMIVKDDKTPPEEVLKLTGSAATSATGQTPIQASFALEVDKANMGYRDLDDYQICLTSGAGYLPGIPRDETQACANAIKANSTCGQIFYFSPDADPPSNCICLFTGAPLLVPCTTTASGVTLPMGVKAYELYDNGGTATFTLTKSATAYTLAAALKNTTGINVLTAASTMNQVGDGYAGDVVAMEFDDSVSGRTGTVHTAFSSGFKPASVMGHDRFDMNISLGAGGAGIDDVGGGFAWFVERGPVPIRAISRVGASLAGHEILGPPSSRYEVTKGVFSAGLTVPYDVPVNANDLTTAQVTEYKALVELQDVNDFNDAAYLASVASEMGLDVGSVEITEKKYQVEVGYALDGSVTAGQAKSAVATAANVLENQVEVTLNVGGGRRLESIANGRRLATTNVNAKITANDVASLNAVHTKVADTTALTTHLTNAGATVTSASVSTAPKKKVVVKTHITAPAGVPPVPPPDPAAVAARLSSTIGKTVSMSNSQVQQGITVTVTTTVPPTTTGGNITDLDSNGAHGQSVATTCIALAFFLAKLFIDKVIL